MTVKARKKSSSRGAIAVDLILRRLRSFKRPIQFLGLAIIFSPPGALIAALFHCFVLQDILLHFATINSDITLDFFHDEPASIAIKSAALLIYSMLAFYVWFCVFGHICTMGSHRGLGLWARGFGGLFFSGFQLDFTIGSHIDDLHSKLMKLPNRGQVLSREYLIWRYRSLIAWALVELIATALFRRTRTFLL